ncbi:hypothetical protein [Sphingomonas sp. G-3-2-10]|uniref:hypothetical protein n=1 Tax=Sphingomonas sp. G-3-2-10 TaxID=2728838 RepID=UPI00146E5B7E|nr:hypothetical protein [Sphingomonas sp. G-3-2-10]NML07764.1 hypothetical protein [Sphingomonas sp. G-3-2-10]
MKPDREDRLYDRAEAISEGRLNGLYMPILRGLALRKHHRAMLRLAGVFTQDNSRADLGSAARVGDPAWLYRRVWRLGGEYARFAAQNMAMSLFNIGDLQGYRSWLHRGAELGDQDAGLQLECFETRLSHGAARQIGRGRPMRRNGS